MAIKNLTLALPALALATLACQLFVPTPPTAEPVPISVPSEPVAPSQAEVDMVARLDELGGAPCEENPDFTCVAITVPLDHFDSANGETLEVYFAVVPATGERYGMYVQAFPGGPGGEGISTGALYWFSDDLLEHYDIVYFDQRGLGLSNPLACPEAYAGDIMGFLTESDQAGLEGYDTPVEQQDAIRAAQTFVEACLAEIGPQAADLEFYGTDQVAEDLESFRQAIGDEQFMLYGASYGTTVAQTYAAAYPEHLTGMVLDGTVDPTLTGEQGALVQERAFDEVLVATLKACDENFYCKSELGGDALGVYDDLASRLSKEPQRYEFPLPSGEVVPRTFTFNQLEFTAAYQMYALSGRMLFLRALAAAKEGDLVPMARLLYQQVPLDPETFTYEGDPDFSDTMFYNVLCTDDSFFEGTTEERIARTIEAGQASNGTVPRLDGSVYTGLTCAYWPSAPEGVAVAEPLVAEGVPVFVLNATLDPATPFQEGQAVFENLADGYHLYVEGGQHGLYGWGYDCPDRYISDFMLGGVLPDRREIGCQDWGDEVAWNYIPRIKENASAYADPLEVFWAIYIEIQLQPEFFYSHFEEDISVACPYGGAMTFGPGDAGEAFTFAECAYTRGFALSGDGSYDTESGEFTISAEVSGEKRGTLTFTSEESGIITLSGDYGGKAIDLRR